MKLPLTLRDYLKDLGNRNGLSVALCSWVPDYFGQDKETLFNIFGKNVTTDELYAEGCVAKIRQKRPNSSLNITYFHPALKMNFKFKVDAITLSRYNSGSDGSYMDWPLSKVMLTFTRSQFYQGMMSADVRELISASTAGSYGDEYTGADQKLKSLESDIKAVKNLNEMLEDKIAELYNRATDAESHDYRKVSQIELLNIFNHRLESRLGRKAYENFIEPLPTADIIDIAERVQEVKRKMK